MSVFPVNRVPDILKRMDLNSSQAEAMKTCFGILAIMSREDANKTLIAKDGMEIILRCLTVHIDRTDVQESGCDLLWSLAFNSSAVKEIIAKYGGAVVLVRALKRHRYTPHTPHIHTTHTHHIYTHTHHIYTHTNIHKHTH
jgi:hypothetical protein